MLLRLFAVTLLSGLVFPAATIIQVRHAEKTGPTGDVLFTEAGHKRAALLAKVLADINLTAVYTSEFRHTQETAEPVLSAAAPGDTILVVPSSFLSLRYGE